jgi:FMN-dependent oxidoreductase (nitrilotriacetate monooxygenase family)
VFATPEQRDGGARRHVHLNAFDMSCVVHQSPGLWRHPDNQAWRYTDLDYWTSLARILERGGFDAVFIADVLGVYDVFGGSVDAALRQATQIPLNEPTLAIPAMAAATEHLGFGVTCSISFEHPYTFARRMSTLDHLTKGRVGWNIVTSYLDSGARNIGATQLRHDNRYDVADEYLEVLYKLWEGSWADGAVLRDRERGLFTDPALVRPIEHRGEYYDVPGVHLSEPSPQRTPFLFQAGASSRGQRFAVENAEAIFTSSPTRAIARENVRTFREGLVEAGRGPYDALVYNLTTVIVAPTSEQARETYEELRSYGSDEGALVLFSGWMGVDLSRYDLDAPVGDVESNAVQSLVAAFQSADPRGEAWRVRDIAHWGHLGGPGPIIVGSPEEVADELESWVADTDVDGFNLAYAITPGTFEAVVDHLVPELRRRGVYPEGPRPGRTLREKLFGRGGRLPDYHKGSRYRHPADRTVAEAAR